MAHARAGRNGPKSSKSKRRSAAKEKRNASPKPAPAGVKQAVRKLDRVSRKFDAAVDTLHDNLENVRACLGELLTAEVMRERWRQFVALADAGILHDLQILATALEELARDKLPPSLEGVYRYAHLALSQLAREFDAQPIHKPGEELTIHEHQQAGFDWSADSPGDRMFPLCATVMSCGWKCGSEVLVKPKVIRT